MILLRPRVSAVAIAMAIAVAVAAAAAGCSSAKRQPAPTTGGLSGSITVFAAASLTGSFTTIGRQFEAADPGTTVTFDFGASSTLAQQILAGAPADVFASAATRNMTQVAADVDAPVYFVSNTAEIAVAPGAKSSVTSLEDLTKPGVTLAVCQPQVPCGALAAKVLAKADVTVKPKTQGLDVKATLAYVTSGQVDSAIVYVTDVRAAGSNVVGVIIPAADNASTSYPIATVKASKNAALANAFNTYVRSAAGLSVLTAAGFSAP